MVDIKNIPAKLKSDCKFCVWKFEKRSGQKTKMPYNPVNGDRARINDLRTFADFKTTLMAYAMGGYDAGSRTFSAEYTAKDERVNVYGIPEREKCHDDFRAACQFEI